MTAIEFNHRILSLSDNLKYFAYSLTSNQEDAQDLVQETYLKAITHKDKFDPSTNMKAWVYTIMKNTFINRYRKESKYNTMVDTTEDLYFINSTGKPDNENPESRFNHSELEKVINQLQDDQRIPFLMHFEGYKYREIAEKLNISIGTVKSRIFLSRQKLMNALKDHQN